jgi:hypothetical protein
MGLTLTTIAMYPVVALREPARDINDCARNEVDRRNLQR